MSLDIFKDGNLQLKENKNSKGFFHDKHYIFEQ